MDAIRHGHVHLLEEGLYCRPSPRILNGLEHLVKLLYPDDRT
jgi:iron complex transport system substrate-binding protein